MLPELLLDGLDVVFDPEEADEREFQRTYQYVMRRGFKSSDILKAMKSGILYE